MLLDSPRLLPGDREMWDRLHRADVIRAQLPALERKADRAREAIRSFVAAGGCYAGVSWGKDSTVLAHLLATSGARCPLVWIRKPPTDNPDCERVRDAFLASHGAGVDYHEIEIACTFHGGDWFWDSPLARGFAEAGKRWGRRHISAIRAAESGVRKIRMRVHGLESKNTLAPIGWWSGEDVFAYLERHGLPIHPAYAMSLGGSWERNRLRVDALSGHLGEEFGRHELERLYYPDELRRLGRYEQTCADWQDPEDP